MQKKFIFSVFTFFPFLGLTGTVSTSVSPAPPWAVPTQRSGIRQKNNEKVIETVAISQNPLARPPGSRREADTDGSHLRCPGCHLLRGRGQCHRRPGFPGGRLPEEAAAESGGDHSRQLRQRQRGSAPGGGPDDEAVGGREGGGQGTDRLLLS